MNILVTGHAGFIGSNLVKRLFKELATGDTSRACQGTIVGIDNLNNYYDPIPLQAQLPASSQQSLPLEKAVAARTDARVSAMPCLHEQCRARRRKTKVNPDRAAAHYQSRQGGTREVTI